MNTRIQCLKILDNEADLETQKKTGYFSHAQKSRATKEMACHPWRQVKRKSVAYRRSPATETRRSPPMPLRRQLSSGAASSRLRLLAIRAPCPSAARLFHRRTRRLYETDSANAQDFALSSAVTFIEKLYGDEYAIIRKFTTKTIRRKLTKPSSN